MKYMVSACLMGENCKYNGGNNYQESLSLFMKDKEYICVCPEVLGGLSIPRACCEIVGGKVMSKDGEDVSAEFIRGAKKAVEIALQEQIDCVITQPRSPSCGVGKIYDGTFQGKLIEGNGYFVKELIHSQIMVEDYGQFYEKYIKTLETNDKSMDEAIEKTRNF